MDTSRVDGVKAPRDAASAPHVVGEVVFLAPRRPPTDRTSHGRAQRRHVLVVRTVSIIQGPVPGPPRRESRIAPEALREAIPIHLWGLVFIF